MCVCINYMTIVRMCVQSGGPHFMLDGMYARNRAFQNDVVVVELGPEVDKRAMDVKVKCHIHRLHTVIAICTLGYSYRCKYA